MIKVLIVDDEPLARENLRVFLQEQSDIEIVGECSNAVEGIGAVHKLRPDVLFLDIQMPRVSGLEMVGMIEASALPHIVFVTAYDEHALKAFEEHATDYLLKPIDPQRLERTLDWLRSRGTNPPPPPPGSGSVLQQIPCLARNRIQLIPLDEVEYIHTDISGNRVVAGDRQGMTELTLKLLQERTPLMRCHRQYLVNLTRIEEIQLLENGSAEIVMRSGQRVPVSRRHLREIKDKLLIA